MRALRPFSRPPKLLGRVPIALVLVMLGLAYGYASRSQETAGQRLARMLVAERFTAGRLTGQTAWQECVPVDTTALVPPTRCGAPPDRDSRRFRRIEELVHAARAAPQPDSSPAALRARALVDLRFADTSTVALERAAATLEQALRLTPDDAGLLNELGVAYLALGQRTQQLTPMLRALDAVERAVERDSVRVEILFNRALVLQRLYLIASAERAWTRYLAVERDPRWRAEAHAHARWVAQVPDTVSWDALLTAPPVRLDDATRTRIAALVRSRAHAARDSAFVLLGAWGRAVEAGDSASAAARLVVARAIGAALDARGADHGVSLAVRAIDESRGDVKRTARLAGGHLRLAEGYHLFYRPAYEASARSFREAEAMLRAATSPASRWATFFLGAAQMNMGHYDSADIRYREARAGAAPEEPGLTGKTVWSLGVTQLRRGNHEAASEFYRRAAPYVERAKETENTGTIAYLLSESLALSGQTFAGEAEALRGLRLLSSYRHSIHLNNHLTTVATYARARQLGAAALAIMDEVLQVAEGIGKPDLQARAHRARAKDLLALHRRVEARAELREGLRWADRVSAGAARQRVRADVMLVWGQVLRADDPRAALRQLSSVADTLRALKIDYQLPSALYEAAQAAEDAGDAAGAHRWLDEAVVQIERQQGSFSTPEIRATFHETVEEVFDAIMLNELRADRPASAFMYLERARAAIQPGPRGSSLPTPPRAQMTDLGRLAATVPAGTLLVSYALLPDRLVIWTVGRGTWRQTAIPVSRDSVCALIARMERENDRPVPTARDARAHLYDLLIRPIENKLAGIQRLAVIPDRELHQVPFAALWSRTTARYVVEDREVATLPSTTFYLAAGQGGAPPGRLSALLVGNPALADEAQKRLPPLPGALRETRRIAEMYRHPRLLTGPAARRDSVLELLPRYGVFHFAGHAVFNGDNPGASYLALASDGSHGEARLQGWEIGTLRLSNVQVVILSACSTLSPRPSRAGAAAGLAYSFLRAGVPATVSTLWDVQDESTTRLLVEFHRQFAAGASAAGALRLAQLQALRSPRSDVSAPTVWAGFVYTGP